MGQPRSAFSLALIKGSVLARMLARGAAAGRVDSAAPQRRAVPLIDVFD